MKTYKDVDEFIMEVFPLEYLKIIKQRKAKTDEDTEEANADFDKKLDEIIKGEKKPQQTQKTDASSTQDSVA